MSAAEVRGVYTCRMAYSRGQTDGAAEVQAGRPFCELAPHDLPSVAHREAWLAGYRRAHGKVVRS